jgi:carbamoyl-phosphate synthase large subunit
MRDPIFDSLALIWRPVMLATVDEFRQVPSASSAEYKVAIKSIIREFGADALLLISEPELEMFLGEDKDVFDCPVVTCGKTVLELGMDKLETARQLASIGIAVPWTVDADIDLPIALPCIMKPRSGCGSKFVTIVRNDVEVNFYRGNKSGCIFQELLLPDNQEITCGVYRSLDKKVAVIQFRRTLVGGMTGWAEVIKDPEIDVMCTKIADAFDLVGSMNVQLRITDKGPRIFEINPRFSSTVLMRHKLGFSDVVWSLDELEGTALVFPDVPAGVTLAKVQDVVILKQ